MDVSIRLLVGGKRVWSQHRRKRLMIFLSLRFQLWLRPSLLPEALFVLKLAWVILFYFFGHLQPKDFRDCFEGHSVYLRVDPSGTNISKPSEEVKTLWFLLNLHVPFWWQWNLALSESCYCRSRHTLKNLSQVLCKIQRWYMVPVVGRFLFNLHDFLKWDELDPMFILSQTEKPW